MASSKQNWLSFLCPMPLIGLVIDAQSKLNDALPSLRQAEWVSVDTEADSLHSYPEKLCLMQVSHDGGDLLFDPLTSVDMTPLMEILGSHEIILHGADYDLRLLTKTYGFRPRAIFDTMLAARFLGIQRFSLMDLVSQYLGVALEKGPQKADWSRRPLTPRMLVYASNDTRYLKPLSDILRGQLNEKNRASWHRETCARLVETCAAVRNRNEENDWRLAGSERLSRRHLGVLKELWLWREKEAIHSNKPPFFILSHDLLLKMAQAATLDDVKSSIPPFLTARRREGLLNAFHAGWALSSQSLPTRIRTNGRRMTEAEKHRLEALRKRRDEVAGQLGLEASFIASRAALVLLACEEDHAMSTLMNWQRELLGV